TDVSGARQSGARWPEPGFQVATRDGLQEPGAKFQIPILLCEEACLRRGMVARGDRSGAPRIQDPGRCEHETHRRWISRAALAHGQRMGHHALRVSTAYGD